jgi:hypothetical protein|tara:strand:- start:451 stop:681 length:231 start_codon:yes stop_codon:yes gene_type:complete
MVASKSEGKRIVDVLLTYLPVDVAVEMMNEMWEEVGLSTDNESLEETILLLKKYLEAKWEYSLPTQNASLSQGHES